MEIWAVISKFIVLCYCILRFTTRQSGDATAFVLIVLLYVSMSMAAYIVKNNAYKRILFLISAVFLLAGTRYYNDLFILLLPINIYELVFLSTGIRELSVFLNLLLLVLVSKTLVSEYFLVSVLTGTLYFIIYKNERRWDRLVHENDEMREKIHTLSGRLNRDREYERQIKYSSQLEERNKIAQEIHDRVGHAIAGSLMQLEAAKLLLKKDGDQAEAILQKTITNLREGMESIRAALRNIKPTPEQIGINRLKLLLDEFTAGNQTEARLFYTGDMEKINHAQWRVITENISEAMTNALKYAGASEILIKVEVLHKLIKAEVRDNGVGAVQYKKGIGITGMEERAGNMGGKMIIDGSRGFSVITLLPLEVETNGH